MYQVESNQRDNKEGQKTMNKVIREGRSNEQGNLGSWKATCMKLNRQNAHWQGNVDRQKEISKIILVVRKQRASN
jgi:hypothetical protein